MSFEHFEDSELWSAIRRDNRRAFDTLFDRYWSAVHSTAFSYLHDTEAASDIVHDIFIKLWQNRNTYKINCFRSYLCTAARYHVYKVMKARKASALVYISDYTEAHSWQQSKNEGSEAIIGREMDAAVDRFLRHLPTRCREIFMLSRREQLSNEEIAVRFGISKRTVENQLTTALQVLRPLMNYIPLFLWLATEVV